ncbi:diguanylate cyclase [Roseofilum capinflatum]|uniref:Diguanylate cyclase n=1 Tax=Roseofilum capinflatum BLCC-M114 TaxID=3022440 RepID=A0ABT7B4R8_9CYAN|nr:diguanylate cyclase [Roseofilum capinflatum]MDJ1173511.1 diguanylate cyclase [Roseofilum capinflatum BLCC-M114]
MTNHELRKDPSFSHSSFPISTSISLGQKPSTIYSNHQQLDWIEGIFWSAHPVTLSLHTISPQIEEITDYPLETFYKNPHFWLDLIHPEDRERVKEQLIDLVYHPSLLKLSYRIITDGQKVQWVQTQARLYHPDPENSGHLAPSEGLLQGFTTTIYPPVHTPDPLGSSFSGTETLFSAVLAHLPHVGVLILDGDGQEILRMGQLWQGEECAEEFDRLIQLCLNRETAVQEFRIGDRTYRGYFSPCLTPEWIALGAIVVEEITAIEQQQIAFQESQDKYQALFDLLPIGLAITDCQGNFVEVNTAAEEILGVSKDQLMQWSCDTFEQVAFFPEADRNWRKNQHCEAGLLGKKGDVTWLELHVSQMPVKGYGYLLSYSNITTQKLADLALTKQAERERLIRIMTQKIRQSLNLEEILETTVGQVRLILNTDRVMVYRFNPDSSGLVIAESCRLGVTSMLGWQMANLRACEPEWFRSYCQGKMQVIDNISEAGLEFSYSQLLQAFQVKSKVSVPIILTALPTHTDQPCPFCYLEDEEHKSHYLWGLLIAHECGSSMGSQKHWQQLDIDLLKQLAAQVAIAIDQSILYQQLEKANQELYGLATSDGLTQLANRRYFDQLLYQEWQRLTREQQPLSLILSDIDFFKHYNDTYGHQAGDDCLKQVALAIQKGVQRPADLVARYGGEEFVVMLPNTPQSGAVAIAKRIQDHVQALQIRHQNSTASSVVTLSLGIATVVPVPEINPEWLLKAADEALYQAKAQGRNQWVYARDVC